MPDPQPVIHTGTIIPPRISPDDIFRRIDKVEGSMRKELEPSWLAQLVSSDKRRQAQVVAQARTSAIEARKELIDGLKGAITVYVDAHVGDLKVRAKAHVMATFNEMLESLGRSMEAAQMSFLDAFDVSVDRISAVRSLTEEQRQEQIAEAWRRAKRQQRRGEETFEQILETLREQVVRIVAEIGAQG